MIADFICDECNIQENDLLVKQDDEPKCQKCGKPLKRLFTSVKYTQKRKDRPYPTHNFGAGERASFGNKP